MKAFIFFLMIVSLTMHAQNLTGTWQVVKQSNCMDQELGEPSDTELELLEAMESMAGAPPRVLSLASDNTGEWNWKTAGKKKALVREKILYRVNDGFLYILDRKSRLITDTFIIELATADTLILFRKDRSCERYELVRTK
ncbi:MAG: hypothetical protein MUE95_01780 [Cyclobacteriaceae bacterium]|jgi:hypothetical protein|nr:hypothetical protein [Cyclobacteriaceae bacterium]